MFFSPSDENGFRKSEGLTKTGDGEQQLHKSILGLQQIESEETTEDDDDATVVSEEKDVGKNVTAKTDPAWYKTEGEIDQGHFV